MQLTLIAELATLRATVEKHESTRQPVEDSVRQALKARFKGINAQIITDLEQHQNDAKLYNIDETTQIRNLNLEIQKLFETIKIRSQSDQQHTYLVARREIETDRFLLTREVQWKCDVGPTTKLKIEALKHRMNLLSCHPHHPKADSSSYNRILREVQTLEQDFIQKSRAKEQIDAL